MKRIALTSAVLLASAACVSQGTYDALRTEHEETQSLLEQRNATIREQEQELLKRKQHEQDLQSALDGEKEKVADLNDRIARMERDLATNLKERSNLEASVQDMTTALAELQKRKAESDARIAEYRSLLEKFRSLIDAGKLKVKVVDGRMVVVLASDVLFGSGSASLSKDGKASLQEVSRLLASIPKRKFQVEGHTDNVPIATAQYPSNWELASARAITVVKTMIDAGMPSDRVSAASFGDSKPAAANDTPEGKAQNRRIEIIIVPDLSTLPGFDELQKVERGS